MSKQKNIFKLQMRDLELIHIGKCGGTTVQKLFKLKSCHLIKPSIYIKNNKYNKNKNKKYIIWIRNPLKRFVSAFNYVYELINCDVSNLDAKNLSLRNCLAPGRIKNKIILGKIFTQEYNSLVNFFKTPNSLAEAITHLDKNIKEKALKLMNHTTEHIYKSIGWYLDNGEFVKKHKNSILFVGKQETMTEDIIKLSKLLNYSIDNPKKKIRVNKNSNSKYLSPQAIKNLLEFYKNSDYKALQELHKQSFIDKETLDSYYVY